MCGVAGFVQKPMQSTSEMGALLSRMTDVIAHRGPDDQGAWLDAQTGVAIGHRRLSILDLSIQGHQPMLSADGRYVMAFNGEIYNHAAMRAGVPDHVWRGHSDTEVLLEVIARFGLEYALTQAIGMFALAVWDRETLQLSLARDRLGEKPLYYGLQNGVFLFGSELKALRAHPVCGKAVDRAALSTYLRYGYVPAPYSIYRGIEKLQPGSWVTFDVRRGELGAPRYYWSVLDSIKCGQYVRSQATSCESEEEVLTLLREIIRGQGAADVPLGTFLSGGIDSTLVTALLVEQAKPPVQSFTIGFHEGGYDEAPFAKAVARHLGTQHTELYVTQAEARAVIPLIPDLYDEPFADSSQIPTFLVSRLARTHIRVALSGDGGDELFGGYNRYLWGPKFWERTSWLPSPLREALSRALRVASPVTWEKLFHLLPHRVRPANAGLKVYKLADSLSAADTRAVYRHFLSQWPTPAELISTPEYPPSWDAAWAASTPDFLDQMMAADSVAYLPDDILVKVDRASMGVSLETRAPFLDHRLFELAWRLPQTEKVKGARGKILLRRLVERYVPSHLMERPKQGFGVPIDAWLRGPLRDWAEALLDERRLTEEGWFNPTKVRNAWHEHLSGRRDWQYRLWTILMFQSWQEKWL